jgi:serine/threonine protein kinase
MELVEGETLADRLHRGPLPLREAVRVAQEIAVALEAAHEKGVLHRDFKPANIRLAPGGRVKLLDFGLAKAVQKAALDSRLDTDTSPHSDAGAMLGTAPYMSPEQARGQEADRRSDIWAFGCVLYEMLAGRRAFEGATRHGGGGARSRAGLATSSSWSSSKVKHWPTVSGAGVVTGAGEAPGS